MHWSALSQGYNTSCKYCSKSKENCEQTWKEEKANSLLLTYTESCVYKFLVHDRKFCSLDINQWINC